MGNGIVEGYARGSRVRAELSEFSMESANDKIRARPFRHTKFQNVSARAFALFLFGDAATIFSQTSERTSARPFPRRSLDHIHHLQRAVFNFHERFPDTGRVRGENTRERSGGKMTVSFIAQKKVTPEEKALERVKAILRYYPTDNSSRWQEREISSNSIVGERRAVMYFV